MSLGFRSLLFLRLLHAREGFLPLDGTLLNILLFTWLNHWGLLLFSCAELAVEFAWTCSVDLVVKLRSSEPIFLDGS